MLEHLMAAVAHLRSPLLWPILLAGLAAGLLPPTFGALALLSTTWATSLPAALKELLRWVELGAAFALVVALVREPRQMRTLLTVVLIGGLAEGLIGFVQFFLRVGPPSFQIGRFLRAYG